MCIHFTNPTQKAQNADEKSCAVPLPFTLPRRSVRRLVDMATDDSWQIRIVPAGHPATPQDVLQALAADESFHVRSWVVRNVSTEPDTLNFMVNDVDAGIAAYARLRLQS